MSSSPYPKGGPPVQEFHDQPRLNDAHLDREDLRNPRHSSIRRSDTVLATGNKPRNDDGKKKRRSANDRRSEIINRGNSNITSRAELPTASISILARIPTRKVRNAFFDLLAMVDDGDITFSDELAGGTFPEGVDAPHLEKFSECYQQLANDNENLLHFTIKETVETEAGPKFRMALARWLLKSCPNIFLQENAQGETALHIAIARYNYSYQTLAQEGLGLKGYELYREFVFHCLADSSLKNQCTLILDKSSVSGSSSNMHIAIREMGVDTIPHLHLFNPKTLQLKDHAGNTPLHLAVDTKFWKEDEKSENRVELVGKLISLGSEALKITNGPSDDDYNETKRMSPYRYHQSSCLQHHKDPSCKNKTCKDVEFILKDAYMHFEDSTEAIRLLYNGHPVSYSHLDLSEYADAKPSAPNALKTVVRALKNTNLDTILQYVYLPKDPLLSEQSVDDLGKYVNYCDVFKLLRQKFVRKIINLTVEDNDKLPHSHEEIVDALKGIEVESWDWVQYDLCCDTIAEAASRVKEVFLYSTGNKAVLQSWSNQDGLKNLKNLEKIHIQIDLRPSKRNPSFDYKTFLHSRLRESGVKAETHIQVKIPFSKGTSPTHPANDSSAKSGDPMANEARSWFACINRFSQFINNMPEDLKERAGNPIVKIAIIDDGIDIDAHMKQLLFADIGGAISFHSRGRLEHGPDKCFSYHFPSSTGHGTEMVLRVLQVFPKAKLYIARLNVHSGEEGNITTTAKSAAEAIRWAIMEKVDIISMSWTVDRTDKNEQDLENMKDAIDQAHKHNILMFCAAKDCGYSQSSNFGYPKNFDKPVFCIGATTEHGNLSESIGSQKNAIDFGLPGENLLPLSGNSEKEKITGSSIATALASGLAGLLLYCIEFDREGGPEHVKQRRKDLQTHEVMKRTLKRMVDNSQQYIPVSRYFHLGNVDQWTPDGKGQTAFDNIVNTIRTYMQ